VAQAVRVRVSSSAPEIRSQQGLCLSWLFYEDNCRSILV
jgi:hypothetical protein